MFVGSVPQEARYIINDIMKNIPKERDIFVCCSGNFTIDKLFAVQGYKVHSNDVSLYSKTIADIALGKRTEMICTDAVYASVFASWPDHKWKDLISVMFVIATEPFSQQKNDYQKMMWANLMENSLEFYSSTIAKLERNQSLNFTINSFFFGDFREHNGEGVKFIFAPTYKGGYERMYKKVDEVFDYDHAVYEMFDSKKADLVYNQMLEEGECVIYTDQRFPSMEPHLHSMIRMKGGKHDIYIYSNVKTKPHYIANHRPKRPKVTYNLFQGRIITGNEKVQVAMVDTGTINWYKHLYMSARVDYSEGGDFGLLFALDGKVFGFASFSKLLGTVDKEHLFLQSDFVVDSKIPRLSKLVLELLLSKEVKQMISGKYLFEYTGVQTSVYTEKPVSSKYRGVFELLKRDKNKLVYIGRFNVLSLQENFKEWLRKQK